MTPDQSALIGLADEILRGRTTNEALQAVERSDRRVDDRLWAELATAGLVGIAVPENLGGAGLGLTELCLLLEVQGRRLAPVPLWETAVLGALPLSAFGQGTSAQEALSHVASGSLLLSGSFDLGGGAVSSVRVVDGRLSGEARLVPHGHAIGALLVAADDRQLYLCPTRGVPSVSVETTTRAMAADLTLDDVLAAELIGEGVLDWAIDRGRVGLVALALGVADEGVREAAAYLSGRQQFGRPLATFQAVSQQLADCYCDVQAMRATLWQAVWALDHGDPARARRAVDVAAWWATEAGARVQQTVQHLHGGMGADITYPVHRRLLWSMRLDGLLGGPSRQIERLHAGLFPDPAPVP